MKLLVVNFVRCTGYKCLNFLSAIQKRKKVILHRSIILPKSKIYAVISAYFLKNRTCCFLYSNFQRSAQNLPMWKITWKSIWNLTKCSDLHSFFFLFTTCSLFCYTTAMSIVRFALLQKKLNTVSQKKTFTGRKGSSLTGSSSQRPHPSYQMVHLTIM